MAENENQGITRRDLLKRGAALGGAVVWATPVVQTLGMGRAFAQTASPCSPAISFIAMCVTCNGEQFVIKWEAPGSWDTPDPVCKVDENCPDADPALGSDLGFSVTLNGGDGCASVSFDSATCSVQAVTVFGGGICDPVDGPFRSGFEVCCPGFN